MNEGEIKKAVKAFWKARSAGTQSDSHPKAFLDLIAADLRRAGWTEVRTKADGDASIRVGGYFRPTKAWDVVCWSRDKPRIAIELKTQADSYGNNENNRYEEALGNALDLRAKYGREVGLGFLFIICEEETSLRVTRQRVPDVDAVFAESSHVSRRMIFARRIVEYKLDDWPLYDAAAVLVIKRDGTFYHPEDKDLGLLGFAAAVAKGRKPV